MSVFETQSGRRVEIDLPKTDWQELEEVREALNALKKERRVTLSRLSSLSRERDLAITKDRDALAKAIRDGKDDPGDKSVEKVEKEIAACNRRREALDVAVEEAEVELIACVDEFRDEWAGEVEATLEEVRASYAEAVEALASANDAMAASLALLRWVRFFPEEEMSYRVRGTSVASLRGAHGDAFLFAEVIQALREDAQELPRVERRVTETQLRHEEKRRNEQDGRGYFTDSELLRKEENEVGFFHGAGAKRIEPMRSA